MNKFSKILELIPQVNKQAKDKAKKDLDEIQEKRLQKFTKAITGFNDMFKLSGESAVSRQFNGFIDSLNSTFNDFSEGFKKGMSSILTKFVKSIADQIGKALDELDNMMQYQYLTGDNRELAFKYGFDPSQQYAFEKALGTMGISEDDLMYMTDKQADKFNELFGHYTKKYNELADSGYFEKLQEYQWEEQEFRQNFTYEVMKWVIDNKSAIMGFMDLSLTFLKGILSIVEWLGNIFGHKDKQVAMTAADVIQQYSGNKTTNVTQHNNFNGVNMDNATSVANTVGLSYEQLVNVLLKG